MAQRKKRKTSIRTAPAAAQKQLLDRIRALRDDPLRVLPESVGVEPKVLAKARSRLQRIAAGKIGFLDRRDKHVVGAVANIIDVADQAAVPRVVDQRIAGQRRFYLQRGHVLPGCSLGVQNHDVPTVLLTAYRAMAKDAGLHFFAGDRLWCTGATPRPPAAWVESFAAGVDLESDAAGNWRCRHAGARVVLGFREGPDITMCAACAKKAASASGSQNAHQRLRERYAGPRQRHPVEVHVQLPDGARADPSAEDVASYRGGIADEARLVAAAVAGWQQQAHRAAGARFVLGEQEFEDADGLLDAIGTEDWERPALRVVIADGHVGARATVDAVMKKHRETWAKALAQIVDADTATVLAGKTGIAPRQLLRMAKTEADRAARTKDLPAVRAGAVGTWIDGFVRSVRAGERRAAIQSISAELVRGTVPHFHLYAFLQAAGGDQTLASKFDAGDRTAAEPWLERASGLLQASGKEYVDGLAAYLRETGTGERLR